MNRDGMLEQFYKTEFCAVPTVRIMNMGIELDFVDNSGAGTTLGLSMLIINFNLSKKRRTHQRNILPICVDM